MKKHRLLFWSMLSMCLTASASGDLAGRVIEAERVRIRHLLPEYMEARPLPLSASTCERSAGGRNDFYSEGDYWWPDPEDPEGPYIRRDGLSNPENFSDHRHAMIRMNRIVGAMASAYLLTGEDLYVSRALEHLESWFINPETRMNPHMRYAQAISGRVSGRGIGIIDGLHLAEVARAVYVMQDSPAIPPGDLEALKAWFGEFLTWISTHPYGKEEMIHPNNHGTCWALQAAAYAQLTGNEQALDFCRRRFTEVLLPSQMGPDGSFPLELKRTKAYGYSLFNLDAMSLLVQILSEDSENLWEYQTNDGRSMKRGMEFMHPYIRDKASWPHPPDVLYWEDWPVRQASLVLGGLAYGEAGYIGLWEDLESDPGTAEVQRNLILRYPLLWMNRTSIKPTQL